MHGDLEVYVLLIFQVAKKHLLISNKKRTIHQRSPSFETFISLQCILRHDSLFLKLIIFKSCRKTSSGTVFIRIDGVSLYSLQSSNSRNFHLIIKKVEIVHMPTICAGTQHTSHNKSYCIRSTWLVNMFFLPSNKPLDNNHIQGGVPPGIFMYYQTKGMIHLLPLMTKPTYSFNPKQSIVLDQKMNECPFRITHILRACAHGITFLTPPPVLVGCRLPPCHHFRLIMVIGQPHQVMTFPRWIRPCGDMCVLKPSAIFLLAPVSQCVMTFKTFYGFP